MFQIYYGDPSDTFQHYFNWTRHEYYTMMGGQILVLCFYFFVDYMHTNIVIHVFSLNTQIIHFTCIWHVYIYYTEYLDLFTYFKMEPATGNDSKLHPSN